MNFITFGKETINLDNVTHITMDERELSDGTELPFIQFSFVGNEEIVAFTMLTWDKKPVPAYHEAKEWLENLQAKSA